MVHVRKTGASNKQFSWRIQGDGIIMLVNQPLITKWCLVWVMFAVIVWREMKVFFKYGQICELPSEKWEKGPLENNKGKYMIEIQTKKEPDLSIRCHLC